MADHKWRTAREGFKALRSEFRASGVGALCKRTAQSSRSKPIGFLTDQKENALSLFQFERQIRNSTPSRPSRPGDSARGSGFGQRPCEVLAPASAGPAAVTAHQKNAVAMPNAMSTTPPIMRSCSSLTPSGGARDIGSGALNGSTLDRHANEGGGLRAVPDLSAAEEASDLPRVDASSWPREHG